MPPPAAGAPGKASNLEYCCCPTGTRWADLRVKNGSEEPFRVRYRGLGNEVFGFWQIGQTRHVQLTDRTACDVGGES